MMRLGTGERWEDTQQILEIADTLTGGQVLNYVPGSNTASPDGDCPLCGGTGMVKPNVSIYHHLANRIFPCPQGCPPAYSPRWTINLVDVSLLVRCVVCCDTGLISAKVPVGHPDFGKLVGCTAQCEAYQDNQRVVIQGIMKHCGLPSHYRKYTFDSFRSMPKSDLGMKLHAVGGALCWIKGHPFTLVDAARAIGNMDYNGGEEKKSRSLVLHGENGYGKTGIAAAACNALIAAAKSVVFIRMIEYMRAYAEKFKSEGGSEDFNKLDHLMRTVPFLVLDEATMAVTDSRRDTGDDLLREREAKGLSTLLTTNYTREEFVDRWGYRMGDIVLSYHWIKMAGQKLRNTVGVSEETF